MTGPSLRDLLAARHINLTQAALLFNIDPGDLYRMLAGEVELPAWLPGRVAEALEGAGIGAEGEGPL